MMLLRFLRDERATTAIEYSLIAALISLAIISGTALWSDEVTDMFDRIRAAVVP